MMNPNSSRLDHTVQLSPTPCETTDGQTATTAGETTAAEGEEGEAVEGEGEENETTDAAPAEVPQMPTYDKNAMEDLAPAERLRINQAISKAELEARQRMIEERIAAEMEKDPDALEDDIIAKVNKEVS